MTDRSHGLSVPGRRADRRSLATLCLVLTLGGCVSEAAPSALPAPSTVEAVRPVQAETAAPVQLLVTVALTAVEAGFDGGAYFRGAYGVEVSAEWPLPLLEVHCFVLDLPADRSATDISIRLTDDPIVTLVQPMNIFSVTAGDSPGEDRPEEDLGALQHGLRAIRALAAHDLATGEGIRVGVVDTGVDGRHRDLAENIAALRNFVGFTDPAPVPEVHGTAIAGVIGAANDGYGITGVAPNADIWGLRACWQPEGTRQGLCNSLSLARSVHFAIQHDVDVLNLSLQGPEDPLLRDLIELALGRGMVLVAARPPGAPPFPASVDGVIAVAARPESGPSPDTAPVSGTRGTDPPVLAPGTDIIGPAPGDRFDFFTGSSLAAAHVTGVVALALERVPDLTSGDLAAALRLQGRTAGRTEGSQATLDAYELLRSLQEAIGRSATGA